MFSQEIGKKILESWELDQNHPHRDREQRPSPEASDILQLLAFTFLASLKHEEGRPISLSICHIPTDQINERPKRGKIFYQTLDSKYALELDSIEKLAIAFPPETSILLIDKEESQGTFQIWGVAFCHPWENRFDQISCGIEDNRYFRPDFPTFSSSKPGQVIVSRGSTRIGTFYNGLFFSASPDPFANKQVIDFFINQLKGVFDSKYKESFWFDFRDTFEKLVLRISLNCQGATVLFLPRSDCTLSSIGINKGFKLNGDSILSKMIFRDTPPCFDRMLSEAALYKEFVHRIHIVSCLAKTDGALVLTYDFKVLGFACKIQVSENYSGSIAFLGDASKRSQSTLDFKKLGTRHNSALSFVGSLENSASVVFSHDGPIRLIYRPPGLSQVNCWIDCRDSVFI